MFLRCAGAIVALLLLDGGIAVASPANAQLVLRFGDESHTYSAAQLLERAEVAMLEIPSGVSYRRTMRYRAIPLASLLANLPYRRFEALQVAATDGFVAEIPLALLSRKNGAIPWIAVDDPREPWPNLANKNYNGGPFYLVWQHPERSGLMSEQWVTSVGTVTGVDSPIRRWPQLDAGSGASGDVRRGMNAYITQCLPCHRFDGAGASDVGPDLGRPLNATVYLTDRGLRALIRYPRAVRSWPGMRMGAFPSSILPDAQLNAIVLYIKYKSVK